MPWSTASSSARRETEARGEPVRSDDNPEVFKTRLEAYRAQTAPLSSLLRGEGRS